MESRRYEVNIFNGTDSSVIGLKLGGSLVLPFVWTKFLHTILQSCGIIPDFQMPYKIRVITVRRKGHHLKDMIEI